jgi:hypothetical protein
MRVRIVARAGRCVQIAEPGVSSSRRLLSRDRIAGSTNASTVRLASTTRVLLPDPRRAGYSVPVVWSGTGLGPGLWSGLAVVWSAVQHTLRTGLTVRSLVFQKKDRRTRTGPLTSCAHEYASLLQGYLFTWCYS